jgi:hypothetical protein
MLENGETAPRCEGDAFHHPAMKMTCVMPAREPKELPAGLGVAAEPLAIEIRQEQKAIGSWRGGFGHCDDGGVVDLVVVEDAARPAIASPPASRMVNAPHAPLAVRMFVTTGSCNGCKLWAVISVDVPVMSEPRCSGDTPDPSNVAAKWLVLTATGVPAKGLYPRLSATRPRGGRAPPGPGEESGHRRQEER